MYINYCISIILSQLLYLENHNKTMAQECQDQNPVYEYVLCKLSTYIYKLIKINELNKDIDSYILLDIYTEDKLNQLITFLQHMSSMMNYNLSVNEKKKKLLNIYNINRKKKIIMEIPNDYFNGKILISNKLIVLTNYTYLKLFKLLQINKRICE